VCGIEELPGHCETGVSHLLSILDPGWPVPKAFGAFGKHAKLELRFHDVIEAQNAETIAPQPEHVADILGFGRRFIAEQKADAHLLVHCHAGVSRSTAAVALILAQTLPEVSANRIFGQCQRPPQGQGRGRGGAGSAGSIAVSGLMGWARITPPQLGGEASQAAALANWPRPDFLGCAGLFFAG
jgi:hypothetical protein